MELTYTQVFIFITMVWFAVRAAAAIRNRHLSIPDELRLLPAYICLIVIARFVYFGYHLSGGRIDTVKIGRSEHFSDMVSLVPFYFLADRYDGWQRNIIGNIVMFIPVGLVWPVCFRKLDSFAKTVLAGAGFSALIEVTQLVCINRHSDIDDIILNTAGAAIGAAIVFAIRRIQTASGPD